MLEHVIRKRATWGISAVHPIGVSAATEREPAFHLTSLLFTFWCYGDIREIYDPVPAIPNGPQELLSRYKKATATLKETIQAAERLQSDHASHLERINSACSDALREVSSKAKELSHDIVDNVKQEIDREISNKSRDLQLQVESSAHKTKLELQESVSAATKEVFAATQHATRDLGEAKGTANTLSATMKWFLSLMGIFGVTSIIGGTFLLAETRKVRAVMFQANEKLQSVEEDVAKKLWALSSTQELTHPPAKPEGFAECEPLKAAKYSGALVAPDARPPLLGGGYTAG